jgi:hypothetical protein
METKFTGAGQPLYAFCFVLPSIHRVVQFHVNSLDNWILNALQCPSGTLTPVCTMFESSGRI